MSLTKVQFQNINTNLVAFSDPITVTNYGNVGGRDIGELFDRSRGGASNVAIIWQESTQSFRMGYTSSTGLIASNLTLTGNANLRVGNVYVESISYANGSAISASAGGSNTQLQYNNNGSFAGATGLTTNGTTLTVTGTLTGTTINAATIGNAGAAITGTLQTAAQTNITSVGTLTGLTVNGTYNGTIVQAATIGNVGAGFTGNGRNITGVFADTATTATSATTATTATYVTGLTSANVSTALGYVPLNSNATALTAQYVTQAAQSNITSVGTLTGLTISGTLNGTTLQAAIIGNVGATHIGGNVSAGTSFQGPIGVYGANTALVSTLTTTGNTTVSALTVNGSATVGTFLSAAAGLQNTAIGNLTQSTGKFTTLESTGATTVGTTLSVVSNATVAALTVNGTATIGSTLGVSGNINGSGVTLTGSLRATGPGDFDGGLQTTPIGNAGASTGQFTTLSATGNVTGAALTVNGTATIGSTLGVAGILSATGSYLSAANQVVITSPSPSAEGGQLILAWPNISGISGQSNSTWNLDVDATNNLRIFYQNAAGAVAVPIFIRQTNSNVEVTGNVLATNYFYSNGAPIAGGGGGTPAGTSGQVQFNNGGTSFGGATALLYQANGQVIANASISSTGTSTGTMVVTGGVGVSGNIYADQIYAINNGNGTNFRIGDDAWLGDINLANTVRLAGAQDGTQAYIVFGNSNQLSLGRSGTGALTYQGAFTAQGGLQNTPIGNATASTGVFTTINVSSTTANAITANFTHGSDQNYQLTAQNGPSTNATGDEVARFGMNYLGTGWDSFTRYIRGSAAQNGSQVLFAGNTAQLTVASTGITVVGTSALNGNVNTNNIMPFGNANANIGSTALQFNTVFAKATSAQYADLAEKYSADNTYTSGQVLMFGGQAEVTLCDIDMPRSVAGVVTTHPAHLMNSGLEGVTAAIALQGRVPCLVTGPVKKGDLMVGTLNGRARAEADPVVGSVIGKALENSTGGDNTIEVAVGRF